MVTLFPLFIPAPNLGGNRTALRGFPQYPPGTSSYLFPFVENYWGLQPLEERGVELVAPGFEGLEHTIAAVVPANNNKKAPAAALGWIDSGTRT